MTDSKPYSLPDRSTIHVHGADVTDFLQGLITQDVTKLATEPLLYSCFLTPQGKYLADFHIADAPMPDGAPSYLLEGHSSVMAPLFQKLRMYVLRAQVALGYTDNVAVFIGDTATRKATDKLGGIDPRHEKIGTRFIGWNPEASTPQTIAKTRSAAEPIYHAKLLNLGICEPHIDLINGQSTLAEGCIDWLNAISFHKGCYVGQELTARMNYRGLAKRRLMPFSCDLPADALAPNQTLEHKGKPLATIRRVVTGSHNAVRVIGGMALVTVRDWPEDETQLDVLAGDHQASLWQPDWWPSVS